MHGLPALSERGNLRYFPQQLKRAELLGVVNIGVERLFREALDYQRPKM
jgi:hypothetical protein